MLGTVWRCTLAAAAGSVAPRSWLGMMTLASGSTVRPVTRLEIAKLADVRAIGEAGQIA
jgi:hypothetical protein